MKPRKIIITGGHVTPALAVIDELKKQAPDVEIVFVGRRYNNHEMTESFEYQEITRRGIRFIHLDTGRSIKSLSFSSLKNLFSIPVGMWRAWGIIATEKPDLVMSFGGYLALPIAYASSLQHVRLFTHEQTIHPGVANRSIASKAEKVFISFPETASFFPQDKVVISGNPIRESIYQNTIDIEIDDVPTIYVTGGSLGAHAVNTMIEAIIPELLTTYNVIHQTGNVKEFGDFERLQQKRSSLSKEYKKRYLLKTHVNDEEIGSILKKADIVVGRAGANTFFELVSLKKPAVLIPLPEAAFDEQRKHARILQEAGVSIIVEQTEEPHQLLKSINEVIQNKKTYAERFSRLERVYPQQATQTLVAAILE